MATRKRQPKKQQPTEPSVVESTGVTTEEGVEEVVVETQQEPTEPSTPAQKVKNEAGLDTIEGIRVLIRSEGELKDKLTKIINDGMPSVRFHVAKLVKYADAMSVDKPDMLDQLIANNNYDLYNTIIQMIEVKDKALFKLLMDITTLVIKDNCGDGEAFNLYMLHRGDMKWKWGQNTLETYQGLMHVFCTLADLSTRQEKLKTIHITHEKFSVSETALNNVKQYYGY